ncbi:MAG: hypothetical protein IT230_04630 [Flavobacteriales bacterium]|nr:hypothetical protein [Flavobacteriales bacterium]
MKVYLLPGVGCDHRLFSRLDLHGLDVAYLDWPPFPAGGTLAQVAAELGRQVDAARPHMLLGVSMGGMVAQELALLTKPEKVVLISTWTGPWEWPWYMGVVKALHLPALISPSTMRWTWPLKRVLGPRPDEVDRLLWEMAVAQGATKIRRGVEAVLRWPGSRWNGPVVRIHGSGDRLIPLRFPVDHLVQHGPHIMVLVHASEVSRAICMAVAG